MSDEQKQFPVKFKNKLNQYAPEYIESVQGADTEEIKKFIVIAEQNIYDIEHEIEFNANIAKLREDLKADMAPYNEAKSTETAKIKFCIHTLADRGVLVK